MTAQGYSRPDLLVETDWLQARLGADNLRVVDCDPYDVYRRAHIQDAVGIRVHHYIKHPNYPSDPTGYPLVAAPDVFTDLMESMGIGDDTQVVAYDSSGSLWSTRFWWVLSHYGHTNAKVLNGGWRKWFDEGRPSSQDPPEVSRTTFTAQENPAMACTLDYGVSRVDQQDTIFLDVRSDGEWDGSVDRGNKRSGRIPGAVHLEWLNFITDDSYRTIKPASELRAMLEERGITPDKEIITY